MDKHLKEIFSIINSMNEAIEYLSKANISDNLFLLDDLVDAIDSCNNYMVSTKPSIGNIPESQLMISCIDNLKIGENCIDELSNLFDVWFKTMLSLVANDNTKTNNCTKTQNYRESNYGIAREFSRYVHLIKKSSISELCDFAMENLKKIKEQDQNLYKILTVDYRGWYFPGNWLDGIDGANNSLITNRMTVLKKHINNFEWFFDILCDYRSKASLNAIINNWLTFSVQDFKKASDGTFISCYDADILELGKGEVYVDAGAYTGDTVAAFINTFGADYKRIYTYEISRETFDILKQNLDPLPNIINNWKGVSDKKGVMHLSGVNGPFHGNKLGDSGLYKVNVVTLDEDIAEPVTFIKIDVEGVDKEAICGAVRHIKNEHPKLVVDSYHKLEDIVEIPLLISKIDPTYKFYLRQPASDILFATGYCIYAV